MGESAGGVANNSYASTSATSTAPLSEIMTVVKDWAADLGWALVPESASAHFALFNAIRHADLWLSLQMEVTASDKGHGWSGVTFTASVQGLWAGADKDFPRAAEAFANGVCHELRVRGYDVVPADLGDGRQNRLWLCRREKFRRAAFRALLLVAIPVIVVAAVFMHQHPGGFFSTLLWLCDALLALMWLRWRLLGMHARTVLYFTLFLVLVAGSGTLAYVKLGW
jgi:hypothetical protein